MPGKPISNIYSEKETISDEKIRRIIFGYDELVRKGIFKNYSTKSNDEQELYKEQFSNYAQQQGCSKEEAYDLLLIRECSVIHDRQETIKQLENYAHKHRFFGHPNRAKSLIEACSNAKSVKEIDDLMEQQKNLFDGKTQKNADKKRPKHERVVKNPKHDEFYEIINTRSNRLR